MSPISIGTTGTQDKAHTGPISFDLAPISTRNHSQLVYATQRDSLPLQNVYTTAVKLVCSCVILITKSKQHACCIFFPLGNNTRCFLNSFIIAIFQMFPRSILFLLAKCGHQITVSSLTSLLSKLESAEVIQPPYDPRTTVTQNAIIII